MDEDAPETGPETRCAVCGRAIELTPRGLGGTPGLGSGSLVDNRPLCKGCQAGRYRARAAERRRK